MRIEDRWIFSFCHWKTDLETLRNLLIVFHQDSSRTKKPDNCLFIRTWLELFISFLKTLSITDKVKVHLWPSPSFLGHWTTACQVIVWGEYVHTEFRIFPMLLFIYEYIHKSNIVLIVCVFNINAIILYLFHSASYLRNLSMVLHIVLFHSF